MLTVCRNCKNVFPHETGRCPKCNAPAPSLPHEYEVERAKILSEKEAAVKADQEKTNSMRAIGTISFFVIFLGIFLWITQVIPIIYGIAVTAISVAVFVVVLKRLPTTSVEYDIRLKELDEKYQVTPKECEELINAYIHERQVHPKQPPKVVDETHAVKCPTCGSTDCERISTASKAVDAAAFGLYGNKRNKQFRCRNCKYMW